ncbi:hypothetical protein F5888DRAFT_1724909 [Russula emetica]|nr:hypothetical protein F5888DRAFT_1724909 [Russula emetica]
MSSLYRLAFFCFVQDWSHATGVQSTQGASVTCHPECNVREHEGKWRDSREGTCMWARKEQRQPVCAPVFL